MKASHGSVLLARGRLGHPIDTLTVSTDDRSARMRVRMVAVVMMVAGIKSSCVCAIALAVTVFAARVSCVFASVDMNSRVVRERVRDHKYTHLCLLKSVAVSEKS